MLRFVVTVHRWLGVVLCLFMAAWFASGAVLIYVPFPSLSTSERLDRASEVDPSLIRLSPVDAIRVSGLIQVIDRMRLLGREGRPLYVIQARGQSVTAIWADVGRPASLQSPEEAGAVAMQFAGKAVRRIEGPISYDQWIVHQGFDKERPYYRVHLDDAAATVLYISRASGEVLQRTTRRQRGWNYAGAVVHWIYPTALRRHWADWDRVVWWLSLTGITVVILGAVLGINHWLHSRRTQPGTISLYGGWLKWHHVLGLFFFAFALTWIFSGWLSMDHGRIFSMPDPDTQQIDRFRGISLAEASRSIDLKSILELGPFAELEIKAVASIPLMIVRQQQASRIYAVNSAQQYAGGMLPKAIIQTAVASAWPEFEVLSVETLAADDVYRKVRHNKLPVGAFRVKLSDPDNTWVHVDAKSGEILSVMNHGRRIYRWIYHGFHSLDFPGLVDRRPLWDILILSLLAIGFCFSITGVYLGARRLIQSVGNQGRVR